MALKTGKETIEVALNTIFKLYGTKSKVILIRYILTVRYLSVSKVIYDEEKKGEGRKDFIVNKFGGNLFLKVMIIYP